MVRTLNLVADIPASRELHISLPSDFPPGPAEIVVVSPSKQSELSTAAELVNSSFFGMWRDRTDIGDSIDFARNLRSQGWTRKD